MTARRARWAACASLLALATATANARAEPPGPGTGTGTGTGMDDAEVTARLAFLERALDAEEASTRLWRSSWLGIYGGVSLVEVGLLASATTPAARLSSGVSAGQAAIGFSFRLITPATATAAPGTLRSLPGDTLAERRLKLHRAEALLHAVATEERFRHSWFPLIGGALVAAGGACIVFAAYRGSAASGWFNAASSLAVAEVDFHTQPTAAIHAWDAYVREGPRARLARPSAAPSLALVPAVGGMAVRGSF